MTKLKSGNSRVELAFRDMLQYRIEVKESRGKVLACFQTKDGRSDYVQVMVVDFGGDVERAAVGAIDRAVKKIETGEAF